MDRSYKLPNVELWTYIILWTSGVLYSVYCFSIKAYKNFEHAAIDDEYSDFVRTSVLSKRKDISDLEWEMTKSLLSSFYIYIIVSLIISEMLRKHNNTKVLAIWQIFISAFFIVSKLGFLNFLVILFQPLFCSIFTFKKKSLFWLCQAFNLCLITLYKNATATEDFQIIFRNTEIQTYMTITTLFWLSLHCVSYNIDALNGTPKDFLSFLSYCLYLPTLVTGPFISYSDFKMCQSFNDSSGTLERLKNLILNICRFTFWLLFLEFCLHYIYVNATGFDIQFIESLDPWSFYGYGFTMGSFFHIKYVVMFGITTSIARFENIPAPSTPKCIARIHLYSDMWKYFDMGLYNFLLKYIYIPSIKITKSRLLSSSLCFGFVFVWHGFEEYILIWTVLNFVSILIENTCKDLSQTYLETNELYKKLDPRWIRRFTCVAASPLLAASVISNFYLFARLTTGNLFMTRFLTGDLKTNSILLTFLYCCCQVSTELRNYHKTHKTK